MSWADHPRHAPTAGDSGATTAAAPLSRVELLEAEHSRVMAEKSRDRNTIRALKKLLWREVARHRRAHRYGNAKDIEVSLHRLEHDR